MAFWSSHFHKSDVEAALARRIGGIKDDVVQVQVVLGNENTENTLVHDVKTLKQDSRVGRAETKDLERRVNNMKTSSDRLKEDIATVRKMKGPQGFGWLSRGGRPLPSDGREGDFYLDASTLDVYKKLKSGWVLFG